MTTVNGRQVRRYIRRNDFGERSIDVVENADGTVVFTLGQTDQLLRMAGFELEAEVEEVDGE